jgi:hypothetical protein
LRAWTTIPAIAPAAAEIPRNSVSLHIISVADLKARVGSLAPADREALAMRHGGSTLGDIADFHDVSISYIFSWLTTLELLLAGLAG